DEPTRTGGQPGADRTQREDRHADHEDAATADDVTHAPRGDQNHAEGQRVSGQDPLQIGLVRPEALLDGRPGDVDDAHADQRHEDRDENDGEDAPPHGQGHGHLVSTLSRTMAAGNGHLPLSDRTGRRGAHPGTVGAPAHHTAINTRWGYYRAGYPKSDGKEPR